MNARSSSLYLEQNVKYLEHNLSSNALKSFISGSFGCFGFSRVAMQQSDGVAPVRKRRSDQTKLQTSVQSRRFEQFPSQKQCRSQSKKSEKPNDIRDRGDKGPRGKRRVYLQFVEADRDQNTRKTRDEEVANHGNP